MVRIWHHRIHKLQVVSNPKKTRRECNYNNTKTGDTMTSNSELPTGANPAEREAVLNLVELSEITHTAINDGNWANPSTWAGGRVPGEGAKVHIPEDVSVTYNSRSEASIFSVRVDGDLEFATNQNTRLVVDTLVVTDTGKLEIGNEDNPLDAQYSADIIIADNGPIDTSYDPMLLSRGIVSLGEVKISGHNPLTWSKVEEDPMAGDTTLELQGDFRDWQVGDTLVVAGTHKQGWDTSDRNLNTLDELDPSDYRGTEDEEVRIVAIDGNTITFEPPLQYDHDTPSDDLKTVVTNQSRNITISSEGGEDTPVHERGHVTILHNDDVDIRYVELTDLGRTDKSRDSVDIEDLNPGQVRSDSNIQGRDPLTIRDTGVADQQNQIDVIAVAVNGSPGWGIVQDNANANFAYNTVFEAFGAAFVSASGVDTGVWHRNVAISSQGIGPGNRAAGEDLRAGDYGRSGDGFFFVSRGVESTENIAANTTYGFTYNSRDSGEESQGAFIGTLDNPEIANGRNFIQASEAPITDFRDNEAFGSHVAFETFRNNSSQGNDLRNEIDAFTAWEVFTGIQTFYSSHYLVTDTRIIGTDTPHANSGVSQGIDLGNRAVDWTLNGITLENFDVGARLSNLPNPEGTPGQDARLGINIIDVRFNNVDQEYDNAPVGGHQFIDPDSIVEGRLAVRYINPLIIEHGEDLNIDWIKVDSLGATPRSFQFELPVLRWFEIQQLLRRDGYHTDEDGNKILLFEDIATDRGTGQELKIITPVTLNLTDAQLRGIPDNGDIELGGPGPIAESDRARTSRDNDVLIDVLENDRDPDGGRIWIDGLVQPDHGDAYIENGQIRYIPEFHYEGVDQISYWLRDEEGNLSRGEVSIRVGSGGIPQPEIIAPVNGNGQLNAAFNTNFAPNTTRHIYNVEDGPIRVNPLDNDNDSNGDDIFLTSFYLDTRSRQFDVRLTADGTVVGRAVNNAIGNDVADYNYTIADEHGATDIGNFEIFVGDDIANPSLTRIGPGLDRPDFSVSLVDAGTNNVVDEVAHLGRYNLNDFGSRGLNFLVESSDYDIGSVTFFLNDREIRTDNDGAFTAFGGGRDLSAGEYLLRTVATSRDDGAGYFQFETRSVITLVDGSVTNNGGGNSGRNPNMSEVNTTFTVDIGEEAGALSTLSRNPDGDVIEAGLRELDNLVIRTFLRNQVEDVESVVFRVNGTGQQIIDNDGNFVLRGNALDLGLGTHSITIEGFSEDDGRGDLLASREVDFTLFNRNVDSDFRVDIEEQQGSASSLSRNTDGDLINIRRQEIDDLVIRTYLRNQVEEVESVVFSVNGTDRQVIDNNGNFVIDSNALDLGLGTHTVTIEGFSRDDGRGRLLASREVDFTLFNHNVTADFRVDIGEDAGRASTLARNPLGDILEISAREIDELVIRTYLQNEIDQVESVVFSLSGTDRQVTDNDGNFVINNNALDLDLGTHTIRIDGFSGDDGRGRLLASREVTFTLVEEIQNRSAVASGLRIAEDPVVDSIMPVQEHSEESDTIQFIDPPAAVQLDSASALDNPILDQLLEDDAILLQTVQSALDNLPHEISELNDIWTYWTKNTEDQFNMELL